MIFYESSHRVAEFARDIAQVFPAGRRMALARELTKLHETIVRCRVDEAPGLIEADPYMEKGEFVVLLQGAAKSPPADELNPEQARVLKLLLEECSLKTAAALTAKITGAKKALAYQAALRLAAEKGS